MRRLRVLSLIRFFVCFVSVSYKTDIKLEIMCIFKLNTCCVLVEGMRLCEDSSIAPSI